MSQHFVERVVPASRLASVLALLVALAGAAHIARYGTGVARAFAALVLAVSALGLGASYVRRKRALLDARGVVKHVVLPAHRGLGQRAARTLGLLERAGDPEFRDSRELLELYWSRVTDRIDSDVVRREIERRAALWRGASLALALLLVLAALAPLRVVEGLDVLVARDGRAPLELSWFTLRRVRVTPPAYLKQPERPTFSALRSTEPVGSRIRIYGVPKEPDRELVLTDGTRETPFTEDGQGGVVAEWLLERDAELFVGARFGEVIIPDERSFQFQAVDDRAPEVWVADTPRTLKLAEIERVEFDYRVRDDHGLRRIDLVIRAGRRVERRTLSVLDGLSRRSEAGHALLRNDPAFRAFLPVEVTLEARDDNPSAQGVGKSLPTYIVPTEVGHAEAERYRALSAAVSESVIWLGAREMTRGPVDSGPAVRALSAASRERYLGLRLPPLLAGFVEGQAERLKRYSPAGADAGASEHVVLALDAALGALAQSDAERISVELGDAAEELGDAAEELADRKPAPAGSERFGAARTALAAGLTHLSALGTLGADLGSVGSADLDRVRRLEAEGRFGDAASAARHLADRLRRPRPSYGARGPGGVEAGVRARAVDAGANEFGSFGELVGELQNLTAEHRALLERAEGAGSKALGTDASQAPDGVAETERAEDLADLARAEQELQGRALNLIHRARRGAAPLPEQATARLAQAEQQMGSASQRFDLGDAEDGKAHQRAAQRELEAASAEATPGREELDADAPQGQSRAPNPNGNVPEPSTEDRAQELRERVQRGLGRGSGRLAPAIGRYAERLLE